MHKKGFSGVRSVVLSVMATCLVSLVVACGGGGDGGGSGASGSITLEADVTSIAADGKSSATITATIKDSNGDPVPHYTDVTFSTNLGHFLNGAQTYTAETQPPVDEKGMPDTDADPTGKVVTALVAGTTAGTAQVTVTSNGVTQSIRIEISGGLPSSISLKASQGSVKSDNSDSTTITATVLDANNAALKETTVTFKATDGRLSAPSVVTDANGQAQVVFSCGNLKKSNRETTITGTANTASKTMVVKITGTVLKPTTDYTNLEITPATRNFWSSQNKATLTIKAEDAGGNAISNEKISVSVASSSSGSVSLSPISGYTDSNGEVQFEVTGEEQGEVTVNISGLGATATQKYTVGIAGEIFSITSPTSDPYSLRKGDSLTVVVRAPTQNQVIFATTCGTWDGGTQSVVTKSVTDKQASAVLSSDDACTATVQVYDPQNPDTTDSLKVNIVLSSDEASQITLQANSYVVAPSTGEVSNTATLQARVRDDTYQIVPNVPVAFNISNSTGGGEYVTPPLAYTQTGTGIAEGIFTSGSMSSGAEGVTVTATVVGKESTVNDSINIVIGGTAGSIIIGRSSTIESVNNNTSYKLPMTAQVVDSNGNPVSGAKISLQLWPSQYATGIWVPQVVSTEDENCDPEYTGTYANEDDLYDGEHPPFPHKPSYVRNLILDEGEDQNNDGQLTPSSSAAGSIPAEMTADDTGVATFYLTYPKSSAAWIEAELTASTLVLGSESRSTTKFWLPWSQEDAENCVLPDSPYNASEALMEIELTATPDEVVPDGGTSTSIIRALVTQLGEPVTDGTLVSFAIISGTGGLGSATSSEETATTTAGQASVLYYSGEIPGEVTIRARLADGTSSTVTLTLTKGVGDPYAITLTAEPDTLSADNGDSQSVLRAYAEDSEGWPVFDGTLISFAILSGSGYFEGNTQEITDATWRARPVRSTIPGLRWARSRSRLWPKTGSAMRPPSP